MPISVKKEMASSRDSTTMPTLSILSNLFFATVFSPYVSFIVLFDLRSSGLYIAVSFVGCDNDTVWRDLALRHFEGRRDGAALEQTFSGAERDRNCHKLHLIDKIIFEKRLKKFCASHYVYIGTVLLFELPYFFRD